MSVNLIDLYAYYTRDLNNSHELSVMDTLYRRTLIETLKERGFTTENLPRNPRQTNDYEPFYSVAYKPYWSSVSDADLIAACDHLGIAVETNFTQKDLYPLVKEFYRAGATLEAIGKRLGIPATRARLWLKQDGQLKPRERVTDRNKLIYEMNRSGISQADIARRYGISRQMVCIICSKHAK